MTHIYLDNNATTPIDPQVLEVMMKTYQRFFANPSSIHQMGKSAKRQLETARENVAQYFGVQPSEIIFTSSGTESLNLLLKGIELPPHKRHIISSRIEHAAVLNSLESLISDGYEVSYAPVNHTGKVHLEQIDQLIQPNTGMLVISAANSETGVLADLEELSILAKRHGILFVVDAVGAIGKTNWVMYEGIDALAVSAHKFHGPLGAGFAYVKNTINLKAQMTGGSQEGEKRAGTHNLPAIMGMAKALEILDAKLPVILEKLQDLRDTFEKKLMNRLEEVNINGDAPRVSNTSNLYFEGIDAEVLMMQLDIKGIAVSLGSACSSGSIEPSKTLTNMYGKKRARNSLRFSFSKMNTFLEVDDAVDAICLCVEQMKSYLH